jgi:hypothetical protein
VVVTARHCVNQTPKQIDCAAKTPITFGAAEGANWITTDESMGQDSSGWHPIDQIMVPSDDRVCGHDIALLLLKDVVPVTEAKPIIPGVQYPMGDPRYRHDFAAIGYGITSPSGGGAGARRIRPLIDVLCIPGDATWGCPPTAGVNDNEFIGGDGTCEGDSGSSAYESFTLGKGAPVSFGVLSRGGVSDDGTTCKQSVYSRLDKWRDLVLQAATTASKNWTLYPKPVPDWTAYVAPVDAGAPEAAAPKKPSNLGDGYICASNDECASKVCANTGEGLACTTACDDATPCNDGMVCVNAVCIVDPGTAAPTVAVAPTPASSSGCSVGLPRSTGGAAALFVGAVGILVARRRRAKKDRQMEGD